MVKFAVERRTAHGRLGKLLEWGSKAIEHSTPSAMIYLRGGHIPHLTWDVAQKQLTMDQAPIYQLTLPSLADSDSIIAKFKKGAAAFCGIPKDSVVHLSVYDPLTDPKTGFNDTKSVAIWTKSGRIGLDVKKMKQIIQSFDCDSFETLLDYDIGRESLSKRMSKAVDRSKTFYEQMFHQDEELNGAVLVSLGGGFSDYYRRKCAVDLGLNERCDGYNVDLHDFWSDKIVDTKEMAKLLEETFAPLPPGRIRYACGHFNPTQVALLVELGIDLFDTSYAVKLAEEGKMFKLCDNYPRTKAFDVLDFSEDKLQDEWKTPFSSCECYSCKKYTRGYLHHLNNTKELLFPILLVIHNLTEYQRMFSLLRSSISGADEL